MDAQTILHELTHAEGLPRAAIKAASDRRTEMVPLFLEAIEDYLMATGTDRAKPTPLFFVFHLLADWKETSAYRPLARLLQCPRHDVDVVFGDGLVETAHRVMAAVCDGDPRPLFDIVLDPEADEYVRSRMCEALAMAVLRGGLDREAVVRFLRDGFMNLRPQAICFVWQGWQSAIAMLGLSEMKSLVKKAFDRGYIDRGWLGFHHFERDLKRGMEGPDEPGRPGDREYTPFGDTIEELSTWYCFSDQYKEDQERLARAERERASRGQPHANPFRGVGRNDPCPCGSGKKFKKCCLHRQEIRGIA